jgi:DNA polymerase-3 subunit delta'
MGNVQVFIVGDAEHLVPQEGSSEAANALLKLLEEPPGATRFILTSSEPGRLLPTIRSRSVSFHIGTLKTEDVARFLQERRKIDAATAGRVATLAQGSIGRGLGFLADEDGDAPLDSLRKDALALVEAALSADDAARFRTALGYPVSGARKLVDLFGFVEEWLRDVAAVAAGAEDRVFAQDALPRLRSMAQSTGVETADWAAALPAVEEARELARGNVNPQLVVAGLLYRLYSLIGPGVPAGV